MRLRSSRVESSSPNEDEYRQEYEYGYEYEVELELENEKRKRDKGQQQTHAAWKIPTTVHGPYFPTIRSNIMGFVTPTDSAQSSRKEMDKVMDHRAKNSR